MYVDNLFLQVNAESLGFHLLVGGATNFLSGFLHPFLA